MEFQIIKTVTKGQKPNNSQIIQIWVLIHCFAHIIFGISICKFRINANNY